jgi:hypothetical protein
MAGFLGLNQSGETATGSGVAPAPEPLPIPDPIPLPQPDPAPMPLPAPIPDPPPVIPTVVINEPAALDLTKARPRHAAAVSFDVDAT